MNTTKPDILVIGCGIFGITAARELRRQGRQVLVVDPGPLPHPQAASTDISKVVRMEYGSDEDYMGLVAESIKGWQRWNEEWAQESWDPLYHNTGVTMLVTRALDPGRFETESLQLLRKRQLDVERLTPEERSRRFPAWSSAYVDGFYNPTGGFVESGRVVSRLVTLAEREGITIETGLTAQEIRQSDSRVTAVTTQQGPSFEPNHVVVAAGAWTQELVPELKPIMHATGHPVFHVRPTDPELFSAPNFPVFTADISETGWYGFPLHPSEGVVKIANHGVGQRLHPSLDERIVGQQDLDHLQQFLEHSLPALARDPVVYTRRCLYCDTLDGHLLIDRHPVVENLTVAAGGSGHAMKMAPVLGALTAASVLGETLIGSVSNSDPQSMHRWQERFRWRHLAPGTLGEEQARHSSDGSTT